jgi:hypothetical protein
MEKISPDLVQQIFQLKWEEDEARRAAEEDAEDGRVWRMHCYFSPRHTRLTRPRTTRPSGAAAASTPSPPGGTLWEPRVRRHTACRFLGTRNLPYRLWEVLVLVSVVRCNLNLEVRWMTWRALSARP